MSFASPSRRDLFQASLITVALAWGPAAIFAVHDPTLALWGVPDLGLVILAWLGLTTVRPSWASAPGLRMGLVLAWATFALFGVAWTASLVATQERLPLYDLLLLTRPVWVFASDLYGAWAPWTLFGLTLTIGLLLTLLTGWAWPRLPQPSTSRASAFIASIAVVVGLFGSGFWTPRIVADLTESVALYRQVQSQVTAREDLADRSVDVRPDVRLFVIESYGDVALEAPTGDRHRALLKELESTLVAGGWSMASGRSVAPTHGGRSWMADATVLTGIEVDRQATFGHVTALGRTLPSLPRFFAEQGYETVLVRPKDRARPGVRLVNHFGFTTTVFHDELAYTGPAVGWGHIPDQYTVDVTEQTVIRPMSGPVFAFFHLATAHYPWGEPPAIYEDAREWLTETGERDYVQRDRRPFFMLGMELSRFKSRRRALRDRHGADREAFQGLVAYDLQVLSRAFATPRRPTLMLWYGDHQPPFIADGAPRNAVVHVLATDPAWLEPFLADGFEPGLDPGPRTPPGLHHRDLFERITSALGNPRRPSARPAE
ncbi:MAG: sulfatase-like hydrolase/transferase [Myxococcota bacterium]